MKIYRFTAIGSTTLALSLTFSPAFAATDEEVADVLIESTADQLDVQIDDTTLLSEIAADLEYAISEDVLDEVIVEEVSAAIDAGEVVDVSDLVDENLVEQEVVLEESTESLLNAFELVKQEFYQCRSETDGPANECARGLGERLQAAAIEIDTARLEELRLSLESLTGDELATAEEELAALEAKVEARTNRIAAKEERKAETAQMKEDKQEQKSDVSSEESPSEAPGKPEDKPSNGKANGSSNGNGSDKGKSGK